MADNRNFVRTATGTKVEYDEGLREFFLSIYNYMGIALALTGLVAYFAASSEAVMSALYVLGPTGIPMGMQPLGWIVALAPLGFVFFLGFRIQSMSFQTAQMTFWAYAALVGLSLSSIFLVYTGASIARVFFITAAVFGGMSLYGYTTKRDLTGFGSFLIMGVFGLIIASVVNWFLQSPMIYFITSALGVLIFTGLVAYDTQKMKQVYYQISGGGATAGGMFQKAAIMGALSLYIDFIGIFVHLLQFLGDRR